MITDIDATVESHEEGDGIPATPMSTTCDQRMGFHIRFNFIGAEFVVTYEQMMQILFSERMT